MTLVSLTYRAVSNTSTMVAILATTAEIAWIAAESAVQANSNCPRDARHKISPVTNAPRAQPMSSVTVTPVVTAQNRRLRSLSGVCQGKFSIMLQSPNGDPGRYPILFFANSPGWRSMSTYQPSRTQLWIPERSACHAQIDLLLPLLSARRSSLLPILDEHCALSM